MAWIVAVLVTCAACLVSVPGVAQAAEPEPELLARFCEGRFTTTPPILRPSGAGECFAPAAIAVDQNSGDIYVAEAGAARVSRYTAWGSLVDSWGWGVRDGTDELQNCTTSTGCRAGVVGAGAGQFGGLLSGLAVDSTGDVYVADSENRRIEKFTPQGEFVLMLGGGVDQGGGSPSDPGNVCTAEDLANDDTCGAGADGSGPGEFSAAENLVEISLAIDTRGTSTDADDVVYVGDKNPRIQRFDTGGDLLGEIAPQIPEDPAALAVDSDPTSQNFGDIYVSEFNNGQGPVPLTPNVYRLDPDSGGLLSTLADPRPGALAVERDGNVDVLTFSEPSQGNTRLIRFRPDGSRSGAFFEEEFKFPRSPSMTLVASSACGLSEPDLLIPSNTRSGGETIYSVGIYGPPPNPNICPPPTVAPTIAEQYATTVGASEATVQARVNPHFWPDAKLYVEYGTAPCRDGGCTSTAGFPGQDLGAKVTNAPVVGPGDGLVLGEGGALESNTTYFYRVVAQSSGGGPVFGVAPQGGEATESEGIEGTFHTVGAPSPPKTNCPNQELRAGASARLPDCRAYELVSPPENGGGVFGPPAEAHDLSSADGDAVTFGTLATGFGEPASTPFAPQYMSWRSSSLGWQTQAVDPPRALPSLRAVRNSNPLYRAFSPDLCEGWLEQDTDVSLASGAPAGVPNLYRRTGLHEGCSARPGYELLTTAPPPGFGIALEPTEVQYHPEIQGVSANGDTMVMRANAKLTPDASSADLFQVYATNGGTIHLVSVLPDGDPATTHASVGTMQVIIGSEFRSASVDNAISADGERIFWTACHGGATGGECEAATRPGGGGCSATPANCELGSLYVRVHPLQPQSNLSSASRCTQPAKACTYLVSGEPETRFLGATPSGSGVLYLAGEDLFERNVNDMISEGPAAAPVLIAGGVSGIIGFSRDLTRVYLESSEVCGANTGADGSHAVAGSPNLYLYEPGDSCGTGDFDYIATLGSAEAEAAGSPAKVTGNSPIRLLPSTRTSRVNPDGGVAIFTSSRPLTGIASNDVVSGKADAQVFRFDAGQGTAGELVCVSCTPTGAAPTGRTVGFLDEGWVAGTIPGWIDQFHAGNSLSESGRRVFFESFSRLTPGDSNDQRDVYEWEEAGGEAQCRDEIGGEVFVPASGGCLSLISSGENNQPSYFLDASANGRDAFIVTSSSLVPQDFGFRDIYDARELGGFPPPPSAPPSCENDGCRAAVRSAAAPVPGSQVAGPGNPPLHRESCKKKHQKKKHRKGKAKHGSSCRSTNGHKHRHRKHDKHQRRRHDTGGKAAHKASGKAGAK